MDLRKWVCYPEEKGYRIVLRCGKIHLSTFLSSEQLRGDRHLDKSFVEYYLIRLNTELKESILPMTQSIDELRETRRRYAA